MFVFFWFHLPPVPLVLPWLTEDFISVGSNYSAAAGEWFTCSKSRVSPDKTFHSYSWKGSAFSRFHFL